MSNLNIPHTYIAHTAHSSVRQSRGVKTYARVDCRYAVFAAELYPSHSTADRCSVYHFFYGARWRFFWELCRQPAHTRCLYEVIPDGSLHNFYIDIDMDKPNRIFGGNDSPSGWPAMWLDMCKIVIPIVDKVVKRILAECLVVDVAELATYCSVGVLPLTCSANGVYANLPNKWSVHMVWKHGNRYLNDIAETRSIFDRVSSSLQRPLRDVLPAHFNPRLHDADASEMLISCILDGRVYTRNRMFRTVGCVKLGKEQRVLVPCQLTPTFKLHSGGIDIHV